MLVRMKTRVKRGGVTSGVGRIRAAFAGFLQRARGMAGTRRLPRLNLGCGDHPLPGFINLDKRGGWTFESGLKDFATESVAAITISHALMYVEAKDIPFVFSEFHRVLVPGGIIRITGDDTENPQSLAFGGWTGDEPFVTLTSPSIVGGWLERAGFDVRQVDENTTFFSDTSICQSFHRGPPHVFFIEGVRQV